MQLSTRTTYGVRALLDIALHCDKGTVLLREISRRQDISASYLEQIILSFQAAGLVRSIRGRKGGFVITKPPTEIKLLDILRVTERTLAFVHCVDDHETCPQQKHCAVYEIWYRLTQVLVRELSAITLHSIMGLQEEKSLTSETEEIKLELVPINN